MITFSINPNVYAFKGNYNPTTQAGREWLSTMWEKVIRGECDNDVNPDAYGFVCDKNSNLAKSSKEVQIITMEEQENGERGIAETVLRYVDEDIDDMFEQVEIRENLKIFKKLSTEMIKEKRINLGICILSALKGDKISINLLRNMMIDDDCTYILKRVLRKHMELEIKGEDTIKTSLEKRNSFEVVGDITFPQFIKNIISIRDIGKCIEGMI